MTGKNKNLRNIGLIFLFLALLSFGLLLLKLPGWLAWVGNGFLVIAAILIASHIFKRQPAAPPTAQNTPASTIETLRSAQQSEPQSPLPDRQPLHEHAFPPGQSSPATAADILHNAQQSGPQAPLPDRQPQHERAFPPDQDRQTG